MFYADLGFELGEASGMVSLQKLQLMVAQTGLFRDNFGFVLLLTAELANAMPLKVLLAWLAENAVQLNLQATLFGLSLRASGEKGELSTAQLQALASICTSLLSTLLKLVEAYDFFQLMAKVEARAADGGAAEMDDDDQQRLRLMRQAKWVTGGGCGLLVLSLGYVVAKVIGAFFCEDSLWNITGCVALDD